MNKLSLILALSLDLMLAGNAFAKQNNSQEHRKANAERWQEHIKKECKEKEKCIKERKEKAKTEAEKKAKAFKEKCNKPCEATEIGTVFCEGITTQEQMECMSKIK